MSRPQRKKLLKDILRFFENELYSVHKLNKIMNLINQQIEKNGYAIIKNCISNQILSEIKKCINIKLIEKLKSLKKKTKKDISSNYFELKRYLPQYNIQKIISEEIFKKNLIDKLFNQKKLIDNLIYLIGPDLSYHMDFEVAISDKKNKKEEYYFVKKYHQEFWSGMGLESLMLWIPINLKNGMGTLEIIKSSHEWGHIPHQNREPLKLKKKFKSTNLKINNGSVALFTALTLHRTVKNNHKEIRIAIPITVRNFNYPNHGNSDLFNFKPMNTSFFTKMRKKLGNPHLTPFRTIPSEEIE